MHAERHVTVASAADQLADNSAAQSVSRQQDAAGGAWQRLTSVLREEYQCDGPGTLCRHRQWKHDAVQCAMMCFTAHARAEAATPKLVPKNGRDNLIKRQMLLCALEAVHSHTATSSSPGDWPALPLNDESQPSCALLEDLALDVLQAVDRRLLRDHVLDPLLLGLQHTDYLGFGAVHSSFRAIRSNIGRAAAGCHCIDVQYIVEGTPQCNRTSSEMSTFVQLYSSRS